MKLSGRILVATDFSPASAPALDEAMRLAGATGAELIIVHAYEPPAPAAFEGYVAPPSTYDQWDEALRTSTESSLQVLAAKALEKGIRAETRVLRGIPYIAITEAAKAERADLVVVGTHGRSGLSRFVLGSVAGRVVAAASCPVLTVRTV